MILRRKRRSRSAHGIVIDVRPSSIGVAVVASTLGEDMPTIVAHTRIATPFFKGKQTANFQPLVKETFHQLEKLMQEYVHTATEELGEVHRVSEVIASVTAPWSRVTSRTVVYKKDSPFRVTESLLFDLVKQAEEDIDTSIQETEIAQTCGFNVGSRSVLQEFVNDYPVRNSLGKQGYSLKLTHATNLIATPLSRLLHLFIEDTVPNVPHCTYAYLYILFSIVQRTLPDLQSFAVINITDEETEIGIVKNGTIRYMTHLAYGAESFVRTLVSDDTTPRDDVISRLQGIAEGSISADAQKHIAEARATYAQAVRPLITTIFEEYYLPRTIVLMTPSDTARILGADVTDIFNETSNDTSTILNALDPTHFPISQIHEDSSLAALAWFYHTHRRGK